MAILGLYLGFSICVIVYFSFNPSLYIAYIILSSYALSKVFVTPRNIMCLFPLMDCR